MQQVCLHHHHLLPLAASASQTVFPGAWSVEQPAHQYTHRDHKSGAAKNVQQRCHHTLWCGKNLAPSPSPSGLDWNASIAGSSLSTLTGSLMPSQLAAWKPSHVPHQCLCECYSQRYFAVRASTHLSESLSRRCNPIILSHSQRKTVERCRKVPSGDHMPVPSCNQGQTSFPSVYSSDTTSN